jgi:hypothetical protein
MKVRIKNKLNLCLYLQAVELTTACYRVESRVQDHSTVAPSHLFIQY